MVLVRGIHRAATPSKERSAIQGMFNYIFTLFLAAIVSAVEPGDQSCHGTPENRNGICELQASGEKRKWKWIPEDEHPCNVERLTLEELELKFGPNGLPPLYHRPVVIRAKERNRVFRKMSSMSQLIRSFPRGMNVTLSSSNSFSAHRRTIPLTEYLYETVVWNNGETFPDQLSNETWYLFGETYTPDWKAFLTNYTLPPCVACTEDLSALAFGIGNRGSGVQWHVHGPGFSEALSGRKHWILSPKKPTFNPDYTSRHWMEYIYPTIKQDEKWRNAFYECTLEPGDMIYFPQFWYHATVNLDKPTIFVSTFTTEHNSEWFQNEPTSSIL